MQEWSKTESIEWFIEGQVSSYDLGPPHPLPSPVRKLDRRHTGKLGKRNNLLTGGEGVDGGGGWREPNQTTEKKPGPL